MGDPAHRASGFIASELRSNMPPGPCSARAAVLDRVARRAIFRHGRLASLDAGFDESPRFDAAGGRRRVAGQRDRKSTRLNSSHLVISYAVFCLKKKKNKHT